MNIYSDFSHSALKYLKDTEVNINNLYYDQGFKYQRPIIGPIFSISYIN